MATNGGSKVDQLGKRMNKRFDKLTAEIKKLRDLVKGKKPAKRRPR
jgi:hypothetical protein